MVWKKVGGGWKRGGSAVEGGGVEERGRRRVVEIGCVGKKSEYERESGQEEGREGAEAEGEVG